MSITNPDSPLVGWGTPDDRIFGAPLNVHTNGFKSVLAVKTGPGVLFGFTAYNSNVAAQFVLLFDLNTAPASGAVPEVPFRVATVTTVGTNWIPGRQFRVGCFLVVSSTADTYTAAAANDVYIDAQYL